MVLSISAEVTKLGKNQYKGKFFLLIVAAGISPKPFIFTLSKPSVVLDEEVAKKLKANVDNPHAELLIIEAKKQQPRLQFSLSSPKAMGNLNQQEQALYLTVRGTIGKAVFALEQNQKRNPAHNTDSAKTTLEFRNSNKLAQLLKEILIPTGKPSPQKPSAS